MIAFAADRHDRHRMIGWFDRDRLARTRVAVVGAGAIGNEVCKNLALLGVGEITVLDFDTVEVHNLTRGVLLRDADVGTPKAEAVARRLVELDPEVRVEARRGDVAALRPSQVAGFDLVCGCVDNFEARLRINELCLIAGVDFVDGAIDARHASVSWFPFSRGRRAGCYACTLPPSAWQRIAQRYSCGWLRRAGLVERKVPTTVVTSSLAAALMVSWGLRMGRDPGDRRDAPADAGADAGAIRGADAGAGTEAATDTPRRVLLDSVGGLSRPVAVERDDACPCCGPLGESVELLRWARAQGLAPMARSGGLRLRLPEEIVLGARCEACGFDAGGAVPAGSRVRSHTTEARRCTRCGAEAVAIEARDTMTLRELHDALDGRPPALPYFWVDDPRTSVCVEIDDD